MIYYNKQNITSNDIRLVSKSLKADRITKGNYKEEFENKLKKFFKCKYCLVVSSGTAAQIVLAKALKITKQDHILMTPLTFVSGPNSIELVNAKSIFIDINQETLSIDLEKLEIKIKELKKRRKKIKAVMVTDYAGRPSDWKRLKKLSTRYNFKLINDNCHALGAKYKKSYSYSTNFADYVIQSFHAVKNITTGEGGALLTNDKAVYLKAKSYSEHGFDANTSINDPWSYKLNNLGFNFRLSDINCALGLSQLKRLKNIIKKRTNLAKIYNRFFSKYSYFKFFKNETGNTSAYHLYPILINFKKLRIDPKDFYFNLKKKYKIQLQKHYTPVYRFKYYKNKYKINFKNFKNTEEFYNNSFSLPLYPDLTPKKINYICKSILNALNEQKKRNS